MFAWEQWLVNRTRLDVYSLQTVEAQTSHNDLRASPLCLNI